MGFLVNWLQEDETTLLRLLYDASKAIPRRSK